MYLAARRPVRARRSTLGCVSSSTRLDRCDRLRYEYEDSKISAVKSLFILPLEGDRILGQAIVCFPSRLRTLIHPRLLVCLDCLGAHHHHYQHERKRAYYVRAAHWGNEWIACHRRRQRYDCWGDAYLKKEKKKRWLLPFFFWPSNTRTSSARLRIASCSVPGMNRGKSCTW